MTWTTADLATGLGVVLVPGSPVTGRERLADQLPLLVTAIAEHGLHQDPRQWTATQREQELPRLLDDTGAVGDAARAVLNRAGSSYFADERTWAGLGYRILQPGVEWPPPPPPGQSTTDLPSTVLADVDDSYDVVVVGAGAGGGTVAHALSERGLRVLLVERGPVASPLELPLDLERNARVSTGLPHQLDFPEGRNPRVVVGVDGRRRVVDSTDPAWQANASAVGGGTLVYGAQAWRFCPEDFRMGSVYGPIYPNWPISYEDLEPYYDRVEHTVGVSGPAGPPPVGWASAFGIPDAPDVGHPVDPGAPARLRVSGPADRGPAAVDQLPSFRGPPGVRAVRHLRWVRLSCERQERRRRAARPAGPEHRPLRPRREHRR